MRRGRAGCHLEEEHIDTNIESFHSRTNQPIVLCDSIVWDQRIVIFAVLQRNQMKSEADFPSLFSSCDCE